MDPLPGVAFDSLPGFIEMVAYGHISQIRVIAERHHYNNFWVNAVFIFGFGSIVALWFESRTVGWSTQTTTLIFNLRRRTSVSGLNVRMLSLLINPDLIPPLPQKFRLLHQKSILDG